MKSAKEAQSTAASANPDVDNDMKSVHSVTTVKRSNVFENANKQSPSASNHTGSNSNMSSSKKDTDETLLEKVARMKRGLKDCDHSELVRRLVEALKLLEQQGLGDRVTEIVDSIESQIAGGAVRSDVSHNVGSANSGRHAPAPESDVEDDSGDTGDEKKQSMGENDQTTGAEELIFEDTGGIHSVKDRPLPSSICGKSENSEAVNSDVTFENGTDETSG